MEEITQENRFDIALETKLWRYMSFAKFASLLHSKKLVLSAASMFNDPYEGAGGISRNLDFISKSVAFNTRKRVVEKSGQEVSEEDLSKFVYEYINRASELGVANRYFTFVNCWHENETESEAMWKLYTASQPDGIAIQTTYGALRKAITAEYAKIGRVTYQDYEVAFLPGDSYFWYKRKSFEHEREVRVMVEADDETRKAMAKDYKRAIITVPLDVDLDTLIENVYVSPFASEWLKEVVEEELALCGLKKPVVYSKMNEKALFFPSREQLKEFVREIRELANRNADWDGKEVQNEQKE